jgi:hypothetical protein
MEHTQINDVTGVCAMQTVPILCVCGAELDRVSTNVTGITATLKCQSCGRNNEFKHSLQPEAAKDGHPYRERSQTIRT